MSSFEYRCGSRTPEEFAEVLTGANHREDIAIRLWWKAHNLIGMRFAITGVSRTGSDEIVKKDRKDIPDYVVEFTDQLEKDQPKRYYRVEVEKVVLPYGNEFRLKQGKLFGCIKHRAGILYIHNMLMGKESSRLAPWAKFCCFSLDEIRDWLRNGTFIDNENGRYYYDGKFYIKHEIQHFETMPFPMLEPLETYKKFLSKLVNSRTRCNPFFDFPVESPDPT